jgi:Na+/melibiose symporter-like transporter
MTEGATASIPEEATGNQRLAILLAMAMFVLVVDTSLRCGPVRPRHGRHRAGHPGVAGRRRSRRGAAGDQRDRPGGVGYWLGRRKRQGKPTLVVPELFSSKGFRFGISQQMLQQISLGGLMIALPIYLQMVLEYNAMQAGLSLAPLSLSMFGIALLAGRRAGKRRPSSIIRLGFALLAAGMLLLLPIVPRADSGWWLVVPLMIAGSGLGLSVTFTDMTEASTVLAPDEIVGINTDARPLALQVALLVPILAGLIGLFNSFGMMRRPDPQPSGSVEGMALG